MKRTPITGLMVNPTISRRITGPSERGQLMGCRAAQARPRAHGWTAPLALVFVMMSGWTTRLFAQTVDNPFNKMSAHHRPIGKGAEYGIPAGCHITNYAAKRYTTLSPAGPLNDNSLLQQRLGRFIIGKTSQGRKYTYPVSESDPMETMFQTREYKPPTKPIRTGQTARTRMPLGHSVKGREGWYYPPFDGGDFEYGFAPKDGGSEPIMIRFSDFDYKNKQYTSCSEYRLDGSDTIESPGGTCGASKLRWPALVLTGKDVNSESPGPIQHALMCTATRHNGRGANPNIHLLNKEVVWPAAGIDRSANPLSPSYAPASGDGQNHGVLPYGTRLCVRPCDYAAVAAAIGTKNKRGLALLEAFVYYGCYVVDGQGQVATVNGEKKAVLQMRVDGLAGLTRSGAVIAGVIEDLDAALEKIRPYLYPLRNPRLWNKETEVWTNGLPYAGGGGPLNPAKSINTAWDSK